MTTSDTQAKPSSLVPESPRLAEIVEEVRRFGVDLIERHRITTDEWMQALLFLCELGGRNEMVALSDVLRLSVPVDRVTNADQEELTPSNVEGPFWLPDAPLLETPASLCGADEPGEHVVLRGRVLSADAAPVPHAIVDIWQTNSEGKYDLELGGPTAVEMAFRARVRADSDGRYEIGTVLPKAYSIPTDGPLGILLRKIGRHPYRPAHFHIRIEAEGRDPLTTMLYLRDDPWLDVDVIDSIKDSLLVEPRDGAIEFDFVLAA
jgi:catechol 1,2-dioxygenase